MIICGSTRHNASSHSCFISRMNKLRTIPIGLIYIVVHRCTVRIVPISFTELRFAKFNHRCYLSRIGRIQITNICFKFIYSYIIQKTVGYALFGSHFYSLNIFAVIRIVRYVRNDCRMTALGRIICLFVNNVPDSDFG